MKKVHYWILFSLFLSLNLCAQPQDSVIKVERKNGKIKIIVGGGNNNQSPKKDRPTAPEAEELETPPVPPTPPTPPNHEEEGDIEIKIHKKHTPKEEKENDEEEEAANKKYKKSLVRWAMLDLGINILAFDNKWSTPTDYKDFQLNYGKSLAWTLHAFRHRISIVENNLNFLYGVSFEFDLHNFSKSFQFKPDTNYLTILSESTEKYKNNKLYTSWVKLPIMLHYQTDKDRYGNRFHTALGGYAGLMLGSNQQFIRENGEKMTNKSSFNMNQWVYGLRGEIGYSYLNFYINYGLNPMFRANEGTQSIKNISIGISLIPF